MAENIKQKEKLVSDLEIHISKIEEALDSMKESIEIIQKGNGKFPFWNGSNAYSVIKNALSQYQTDVELLGKIKECQKQIKK